MRKYDDLSWVTYQEDWEDERARELTLLQEKLDAMTDATIMTLPYNKGSLEVATVIDEEKWPWPTIIMEEKNALKICHVYPLDVIVLLDSGSAVWVRVTGKKTVVDSKGRDTGYIEFTTGKIPVPEHHEPRFSWDLFSGA